jgi:insulysin
MKSQFKGAKFDPASAAAILEAFGKHGVQVDQAALTQLAATKPELKVVKDYANGLIDKAGVSAEAITELKALIDGLEPAQAADPEAKLREGNVVIDDIHAFKASLTPAKAAVPLEPLVLSKL